jgi:hypothetical protein
MFWKITLKVHGGSRDESCDVPFETPDLRFVYHCKNHEGECREANISGVMHMSPSLLWHKVKLHTQLVQKLTPFEFVRSIYFYNHPCVRRSPKGCLSGAMNLADCKGLHELTFTRAQAQSTQCRESRLVN